MYRTRTFVSKLQQRPHKMKIVHEIQKIESVPWAEIGLAAVA